MTKLLAFLKREPAALLGVICAVAVFLLTRYLGVDASLAHQVVFGVVPLLFALVTRQFVTPANYTLPSVMLEGRSLLTDVKTLVTHPDVIAEIVKALTPVNAITTVVNPGSVTQPTITTAGANVVYTPPAATNVPVAEPAPLIPPDPVPAP